MYNELTENDIKQMQEEIDHRINVIRPQISQAIIEAKAHGDLSENAEYHAARAQKGRNESRIEYLKAMIKTAKIVKLDSASDKVGMFDKVTVLFEDEGEEEVVQLSTTMRNDASKGIISKESPFGQAILGRKIGDRVKIKVSDSYSYFVEILKIEKATGDNVDLPIL